MSVSLGKKITNPTTLSRVRLTQKVMWLQLHIPGMCKLVLSPWLIFQVVIFKSSPGFRLFWQWKYFCLIYFIPTPHGFINGIFQNSELQLLLLALLVLQDMGHVLPRLSILLSDMLCCSSSSLNSDEWSWKIRINYQLFPCLSLISGSQLLPRFPVMLYPTFT